MERLNFLQQIKSSFKNFPIVVLLGPRQCGKTTIANQYKSQLSKASSVHFFDLEKPSDLARLENPQLALDELEGLIIIDEIQRRPDLFPVLRYLVDHKKRKVKYLILGSASVELIKQTSESLAGRVKYIEVTPFSIKEITYDNKLWLRGGYPRSFLAKTEKQSYDWREQYIRSFLERDIPNLGINIPAVTMRKFWMMLTHYHGQILNSSEIGSSMGFSDHTCKKYLDILSGTFMIRQLQPWFANISKRQVKSPKIYFRDSGLFHSLLGITTRKQLLEHPKLGASWEGFSLESVISHLEIKNEDAYFWSSHSYAELDLFSMINSKPTGFEIKYTDNPKVTKSMKIVINDLKLKHLYIIHPGEDNYKLDNHISAISIKKLDLAF